MDNNEWDNVHRALMGKLRQAPDFEALMIKAESIQLPNPTWPAILAQPNPAEIVRYLSSHPDFADQLVQTFLSVGHANDPTGGNYSAADEAATLAVTEKIRKLSVFLAEGGSTSALQDFGPRKVQ